MALTASALFAALPGSGPLPGLAQQAAVLLEAGRISEAERVWESRTEPPPEPPPEDCRGPLQAKAVPGVGEERTYRVTAVWRRSSEEGSLLRRDSGSWTVEVSWKALGRSQNGRSLELAPLRVRGRIVGPVAPPSARNKAVVHRKFSPSFGLVPDPTTASGGVAAEIAEAVVAVLFPPGVSNSSSRPMWAAWLAPGGPPLVGWLCSAAAQDRAAQEFRGESSAGLRIRRVTMQIGYRGHAAGLSLENLHAVFVEEERSGSASRSFQLEVQADLLRFVPGQDLDADAAEVQMSSTNAAGWPTPEPAETHSLARVRPDSRIVVGVHGVPSPQPVDPAERATVKPEPGAPGRAPGPEVGPPGPVAEEPSVTSLHPARALIGQGRLEEARQMLHSELASGPSAETYLLLAITYRDLRRDDQKALVFAEKAAARQPTNEAHAVAGSLCHQVGLHQKAVDHLLQAAGTLDFEARFALGDSLVQLGRAQEGRDVLQKLLDSAPPPELAEKARQALERAR
jgi:hypothetical protein